MPVKNPQALLKRLIEEPNESVWVEFKENNSDPDMIGSWLSACANGAILSGKERGFLVFGVHDKTRRLVGTSIRIASLRKGGENFVNWISRMIEPRLMMEFLDFELDGIPYAIVTVEPTYDRPVRFAGVEYLRIGENIKKLSDFENHERSLWSATANRRFEDAIAATHQLEENVFSKLDIDTFYLLAEEQKSLDPVEIIRKFEHQGFIRNDLEGGYEITNMGALVLARDLRDFSAITGKAVRVIQYEGSDKRTTLSEKQFTSGYAVAFARVMRHITTLLPKKVVFVDGVRSTDTVYPQTVLREIIANAMIHQDLTINGAGPLVEIYRGRIEISNPGGSLIEVDRIIDERRSRNQKFAMVMRTLHLCEERGSGLDKAGFEIEDSNLPAPEFISSKDTMRVVLYGPKAFQDLTKTERQRACFLHCI